MSGSTTVPPTAGPASSTSMTTRTPPRTSTGATATSPGTAQVPAGMAGVDLEVLPTSAKRVALTFDAGANAAGLNSILTTLSRTKTPATFFLTGDFVDTYPAQSRRIATAGYTVGNHTQDHKDLTALRDSAVRSQISSAQGRIVAVTGIDPRPWFRFPFGESDSRTIADANALGYACIRWTVDTLGWKGTSGGQSVSTVRDRVLAAARPGEIALMHIGSNPDDGTTLDADALPQIISELRSRGYTMVGLDAFLD